MALDVRAKRAYDPVEDDDGYRVLIDHVWPRGVARERARLDAWARELAPSDGLRTWFNHDAARFAEFRARYRGELAEQSERMEQLRRRAASGPVDRLRRSRSRTQQRGRGVRVAARRLRCVVSARLRQSAVVDGRDGRRGSRSPAARTRSAREGSGQRVHDRASLSCEYSARVVVASDAAKGACSLALGTTRTGHRA
jgi:uncharacterized protein YeaO (DUF488 family)